MLVERNPAMILGKASSLKPSSKNHIYHYTFDSWKISLLAQQCLIPIILFLYTVEENVFFGSKFCDFKPSKILLALNHIIIS